MDADPPSWHELLRGYELRDIAPTAPSLSIDPAAACRDALQSAALVDFARSAAAEGRSLTLVINDPHRLTDTPAFLDAVVGLLDAGLAAEKLPALRVLVATGSHLSTPEERAAHEAAMLSRHADRLAEVAWHDARNESGLRKVGNHVLHSWMAEGGFYLGCGSMEPHYFAGITGAHKTLTVGVMSMESLTANHEHALSSQARPLKLDGNPVHVGVVDALADLEDSGARLLALNQVLVDGKVIAVTAGHPLEALNHGIATVRACFSAAVEEPVDLVVAQVQGPLSRDLYQADKGIKNTEAAVREDGVLLLESPCPKGVGIDHFVELLRAAPTVDEARAIVQERGYRLGDHKAVRLRALTDERRVHIGVVSRGVPADLGDVLGMRIFADRAAAAAWARELLGGDRATGLIVADAGNVAIDAA
ncbi:MAG TPA: lactate racemase domain-containing protein [Candidatus Limnocylindrales bacterium]|nr:lactate racemase domain-containing protein [Candidatus Limnocylindrales bacterium]